MSVSSDLCKSLPLGSVGSVRFGWGGLGSVGMVVGMYNPNNFLIILGIFPLLPNSDMREANYIGADKYFHSRGNYDAAQRGPGGAWAAGVIR